MIRLVDEQIDVMLFAVFRNRAQHRHQSVAPLLFVETQPEADRKQQQREDNEEA